MNVSHKIYHGSVYDFYKLSKHDRGKRLNTWFPIQRYFYKGKRKIESGDSNEYFTFVKVDAETANCLYQRKYNPLSIWINKSMVWNGKKYERPEGKYDMKVHLHSIDDSSYGIWFNQDSLETLELNRMNIMSWVSEHPVLNGEVLLTYCETLGGTDKDYN